MTDTTKPETCVGLPNQSKCGTEGGGNAVPVYDVLNCGPRHRFVANGKLIGNSNWQNFPRSDPAHPEKGALRRAVKAP
jgi:hypothetical protein